MEEYKKIFNNVLKEMSNIWLLCWYSLHEEIKYYRKGRLYSFIEYSPKPLNLKMKIFLYKNTSYIIHIFFKITKNYDYYYDKYLNTESDEDSDEWLIKKII
jgi:hypothetical protein